MIFEEKASGANRARPELARAVGRVGRGDILVVARIDRLVRSLVHLLEVIERVEAVGRESTRNRGAAQAAAAKVRG